MNRIAVLVAAVFVVVTGGAAIWWFGQGTEAPSVDVTAPSVETTTPAAESMSPTSAGDDSTSDAVTYALTDATRALFVIDEELRGQPMTVTATSSLVLGEMVLDPADPVSAQLGTILVNARDFTTDSSNRNRAIRGPILDSDTFEFVEFATDSIDRVESSGGEVTFTVTGDLTIRGVANRVTFDVRATLNGDETITGTAEATVDHTDWGLNIPKAPGVANVSELVTLRLEFVAAPTA